MNISVVRLLGCLFLSLMFTTNLCAQGSSLIQDKFGQTIPAHFQKKIEEAKQYRLPYNNNYNPARSVKIIKELLTSESNYYRGYYNLGFAYSELKDYKKSISSFRKALEIRKKKKIEDVTIFNSFGWVLMNNSNYKEAENFFKQGLELKEKNSIALNRALYNNLGLLYFYTQKFKEAEKYLKVAIDEYGSDTAADTLKKIHGLQQKEEVSWRRIGHAIDIVAMTAIKNKLYAASRNNELWVRERR
ncbi:MAG: tetratricopeptide repeat protein [Candidatus Electrothrix sp. ATG2]|nr:tetratricopeptide repeat protein [Candidatus Electrothrix sp. ATG2]